MADADVITALIILGILEPAPTPAPTTAAAEAAADAAEPQGAPASAAPKSDAGVAGPAFKPKDTAALRAVAVQVKEADTACLRFGRASRPLSSCSSSLAAGAGRAASDATQQYGEFPLFSRLTHKSSLGWSVCSNGLWRATVIPLA